MKTSPQQVLVFTGLDGAILNSHPDRLQDVLPALELLRSHDIPLIATTVRTAAEVMPILEALDLTDPFIIENGGALYIPVEGLKVSFPFQKTVGRYRVVELGIAHSTLLKKITKLRQNHGFHLYGFSEISPKQASDMVGISLAEIRAAQTREYSEPIIFQGSAEELQQLHHEVEKLNLRLTRLERSYILTGDHDEGSAVRLLTQLYREEYADKAIVTIGLGDTFTNAAMLYAVDLPVLVRKADGSFDDQIGRRSLKFTRNPGPVGWNQAIIALVTEDPEA